QTYDATIIVPAPSPGKRKIPTRSCSFGKNRIYYNLLCFISHGFTDRSEADGQSVSFQHIRGGAGPAAGPADRRPAAAPAGAAAAFTAAGGSRGGAAVRGGGTA